MKFEPCTRNDGEAHSYIILRIFVPALSLQQSMRSSHQSCTHWAGEGAGVCVGPDVEGACTTTLHVIVALGIIKYVLRVSVTAKWYNNFTQESAVGLFYSLSTTANAILIFFYYFYSWFRSSVILALLTRRRYGSGCFLLFFFLWLLVKNHRRRAIIT